MDEGSIVLDYKAPPGTSLEETDRILVEVEKIIVKIPEVATYSRRTGAQMGFFITEPNDGDYLIQLKDDRKEVQLRLLMISETRSRLLNLHFRSISDRLSGICSVILWHQFNLLKLRFSEVIKKPLMNWRKGCR